MYSLSLERKIVMKGIILCGIVSFLLISCLFAQGGGNSLDFEGFDDWLNCGTNVLNISDSLTIEAWIKARNSQSTGYSRILDKYNFYEQGGFNFVTEFLNSGGSVMLDFWATDGTKNSLVGVTQVNDTHWHHIVAIYDGNAMKIYIDSELESQNVIGVKTIKASTNVLGIGNNFDGATWFPFNGQIEEVRLWSAALDSVTIRSWIHKRLTANHPAYSNLVGYWKFNEGSGTTASDSSGNDNHGSLTNMDTTAAWLPSTVPLATNITETLSQLSAVWVSKNTSTSSIMSVTDDDISGDESIIFGHDNAGLTWDTLDVPVNSSIRQRLNRIWRMEVYGSLAGNIIFDVRNLDIINGNSLKLLVDSNGVFLDAETVSGIYNNTDSTFVVSGNNFQHAYYYSLGTQETPTSIKWDPDLYLPETPQLSQNYPNPFNPSTIISWKLASRSFVTLKVYDVLGNEVETLINEEKPAGIYKFSFDGSDLTSGVYFYELRTGQNIITKKMILLR
jgi:Concanavalin A-like lectin/glucanases superfamily/Secretion system C-terminal sorting domain